MKEEVFVNKQITDDLFTLQKRPLRKALRARDNYRCICLYKAITITVCFIATRLATILLLLAFFVAISSHSFSISSISVGDRK